jgi:3-methyladenine DNA glycosylase AlkD
VHRALKAVANPARAAVNRGYFKTGPGQYGAGDRFLGVAVPDLRRIAREFETLPRADLLRLLQSPWHEKRLLALLILVRQYGAGDRAARDGLFALYLANTRYINNWDLVDLSAGDVVGAHLRDGGRSLLARLAKSDNLWERRIAIIATYHYIRRGDCTDALKIARLLLTDSHDLIHKAVGWMLREVGKRDRVVAERFLRRHASRMPRTMLRYAIERFPGPLRRRYLAR